MRIKGFDLKLACRSSFATLLISAFFVGCSNDDPVSNYQPDFVADFNLDSISQNPVLICQPWKHQIAVPVAKGLELDFTFSGKYFDWSVEQGENSNYLVLKLKDEYQQLPKEERRSFVETVKIRGLLLNNTKSTNDDEQNLYVVCQSTSEDLTATIPAYTMDNIGKSINLTGDILPAPIFPMLNVNLLTAEGLIYESAPYTGGGFELSGERFEETHSQMTEQLGLSWNTGNVLGSLKAAFSGGFSQSFSKEKIESNEFEYHFDIYRKDVCQVTISASLVNENMDMDVLTPYLTKEALALNDVKRFPQTKEGYYNLFDTYGTHIITGGAFGGIYMFVYTRKQTCSYESTANSAGMNLALKFPKSDGGGSGTPVPENWLQTYYKAMSASNGKISADGSNFNSDEHELNEEKSFFVVRGGNMDIDFESWSGSLIDKNSNLSLISYKSSSSNMPGIVPIYMMVTNPIRREEMKQYLEQYMKDKEFVIQDPKLVIVDFCMRNGADGYKEEPKAKKFTSMVDNKERMYLPIVANNKLPESDFHGRMLETSNKHFIAVGDDIDQLWYVAYDYFHPEEEHSYGIERVCFMTEDEAKNNGYTKSGNRADHKMNWPAIDDHYVCLKVTRDPNKMITGVGLQRKDGSKYDIIATSPGTDMLAPYTLDTQFAKYWSSGATYYVGLPPYEGISEANSWFGEHLADGHTHWIHPVYTREPLSLPLRPCNSEDIDETEGNFMMPLPFK